MKLVRPDCAREGGMKRASIEDFLAHVRKSWNESAKLQAEADEKPSISVADLARRKNRIITHGGKMYNVKVEEMVIDRAGSQ